ncbi:MAG TPA: glycosyltransferase family 39 protein, partial [Polyangiaceae bacterium]|nr:glycosyltransferase family 39 protein [Polyangiaceae bacterium]
MTSSPFFSRHRSAVQVSLLLAASATARLLFLACLPPHTYSADVQNWRNVASALQAGQNPYNVTTFLNWPPLWMQVIFVMNKLAAAWQLDLATVIRLFLGSVESLLLVACHGVLRQLTTPERAFRLALFGVALNPIAILLVCQHCNFDVIAGLFVLLATFCVVRYSDTNDEREWLYACCCLGIAILAKTVPIVLVPLLGFGLRQVSWRSRLLGSVLLLGPVTLGMSVIYALGPEQVTDNVLHYRSSAGWFGLTGFFELPKWHRLTELYTEGF